jgi:tRNA-binding protein
MAATWEDFLKIEMRVGRVILVEEFPEAKKPAWKLWIDFGGKIGVKKSSAQVRNYPKGELLGRLVVCVVNFAPKRVAGFESEVLVMGAVEPDGRVVLLKPDSEAQLGDRVA